MADMLIVQDIYLHLVDTAMSGITTSYRELGQHLLLKRAVRVGNEVTIANTFGFNASNRTIRINLDPKDEAPEVTVAHLAAEAAEICDKKQIDVALDSIAQWAREKGLPPLTSLVVRQSGGSAGQVGAGFWKSLGFTESFIEEVDNWTIPLRILHRQCHEYYEGIGIANNELRSYVFDREIEMIEQAPQKLVTEYEDFRASMMMRKNVRKRTVARNGCMFAEAVDIFALCKRWMDHHFPEVK